ncbi:MAG: CDP-diacylglycerol--glycerol-3-phosphate 3-phosphatidyltransferase [Rhodospirillaceae bacterium]|nr:CDP-diacylglycerol--glycerol-3-phosphate 3-phosphatidyltransferase [Rhodospirillaceae bacterium]
MDDRLLTLPNILTGLRIVLIPPLLALFYVPAAWAAWAAAAVFVVAAVTDFFDGYLARRRQVVSLWGRLFDPIADKMLVAAALMALVAFGRVGGIHILAAVIILLREILISGLREFLAGAEAKGIPVTPLAKWKTTVQMAAIAMLIVGQAGPGGPGFVTAGLVGLWLAAALTVITGWQYMAAGLRQIRTKRQ